MANTTCLKINAHFFGKGLFYGVYLCVVWHFIFKFTPKKLHNPLTIFLLVLISLTFIIGCNSHRTEPKIVEFKDSKGRIIEKRITDYDCCEGLSERIILYDTLGNIINEFSTVDYTKTRTLFFYDPTGNIINEKRFEWLTDENVNDSLLTKEKIYEYYQGDKIKNIKIVAYYLDDWDTLSFDKITFNQNGDTTAWTQMNNLRSDYEFGDSAGISYRLHKCFSDKLKETTDTLINKRVKSIRYHRTDF